MPENLLTIREAAEFLRTSPHGVYKLVERRRVPHIRVGRKLLFDPAALRAWISRLAVPEER